MISQTMDRQEIDSMFSESVYFSNPIGSLTINAGSGDDVVTISSIDSAYNAALTINGGTGNDAVNLNADISFAAGKNLSIDLQDDDLTPGVDQINFGSNTDLVLAGTGVAVLKASRNIILNAGSSIVTMHGNLTLEANQQVGSTSGTLVDPGRWSNSRQHFRRYLARRSRRKWFELFAACVHSRWREHQGLERLGW